MPSRDKYRDREGRTFNQFVADNVMAAVAADGRSIRQVATAAGINRETLRERINNTRPFTTAELSSVAYALDVPVAVLVEGF